MPRWSQPWHPLLLLPLGILCAEPLEAAGLVLPLTPSLLHAGCAASPGKCCGEEVSIVLEHATSLLPPVPLSHSSQRIARQRWRPPELRGHFSSRWAFVPGSSTRRLLSVGPAFGFGADNKEFLRNPQQG